MRSMVSLRTTLVILAGLLRRMLFVSSDSVVLAGGSLASPMEQHDAALPPKLEHILRRLIWLKAPKVTWLTSRVCSGLTEVFVLIIMMIGCHSSVDLSQGQFEFLEFYSGAARLCKIAVKMGRKAAAMDKIYDRIGDNVKKNNGMDMNTSAGFMTLGWDSVLISELNS